MTAKVIKLVDGRWAVVWCGEVVAGPFDLNDEAWRALDRMTGDPISRSEKTPDWLFHGNMGGLQ